jgi:hypothetical protein
MAQFIPTVPGVGGSFGTGISKSLNALAEAKIKQMIEAPQRQAYADALAAILGANPEQVQQDESILQQGAGQNVAAAGQPAAQEAAQLAQQQQMSQEPLRPRNPNQALLDSLKKGGLSEQQAFQLGGLAQQKQLRTAEQAKQVRKEERDKQKEINASTQKYYDSVLDNGKAAKNNLKRIKRLEELSLNGSLPPAELYKFVTKIEEGAPNPVYGAAAGAYAGGQIGGPVGAVAGGALGAFLGPLAGTVKAVLARQYKDTEEFEKLSADFIRDAKGIFGGRITDADLAAFFQSIPTLNQTKEGRLKIMKNMKAFNEAAVAEQDALEEIIKENGGERPSDLRFRVQKRVEEKINKAAKDFEI